MKMRLLIMMCLCLLGMPLAARADGLSVRLIEARAQGDASVDPGLADLQQILGQLPLKSFVLVGNKMVALPAPAGTVVPLQHGLSMTLEGPADNLKVKVLRGDEKVMDTTLSLRAHAPYLQNVGTVDGKTLVIALLVQ